MTGTSDPALWEPPLAPATAWPAASASALVAAPVAAPAAAPAAGMIASLRYSWYKQDHG